MSTLVVMAAGREGPGSWFVVGVPVLVATWVLVMGAIALVRARKVRRTRAARTVRQTSGPQAASPAEVAAPAEGLPTTLRATPPAADLAEQARRLDAALGRLAQVKQG